MLQHGDARPHVARICAQFLKAENIPALPWPACSPDMSPIEHVWDSLDRRIRQRVPVSADLQQLQTAVEEEWSNIPEAINLVEADVVPDTDWFPVFRVHRKSWIFEFSHGDRRMET